ncbi:MAG: uroporphyrinogen decarboxylase family protein [Acidobacteriota bacterium]
MTTTSSGSPYSGRQRLLAVFKGEPVDRIPVAPFVHANLVRAYFGLSNDTDVVEKTVSVYEAFGLDLIHRNCTPTCDDLNLAGDGWKPEIAKTLEGRNETTRTVIRTPGGTLEQVHQLTWFSPYDAESTAVDYLIKSETDLDLLVRYQPPVGVVDASPIRKARLAVADEGLIAPWVQGAFNHVAFYFRRIDDLLTDAMLNPPFYHRMMEYFLERNQAFIGQLIEAGVDILSYAGNIGSAKMIGEGFFREFVLPYERRLIQFIESKGVFVLYHNCGYARRLLHAYNELGMTAYESLTPPPYGDTDLDEAFEILDPKLVLIGNVDQIEFVVKATPAEIRRRVAEVLDKARRRGRFILGTSDYFNEFTPHENIRAFADTGRECGWY